MQSYLKKIILAIFVVGICYLTSFSQQSLFSAKTFVNKGDTLNYRFLMPDYNPKIKLPLVVFLHGGGEKGKDNEAQLKWGVCNFASDDNMKNHPAFVIAPQCPDSFAWSNTKKISGRNIQLQEKPSKPMELVHELILQICKDMPIDTNRIYITGMSMGGFGTFDALERYPNLFAAAVPICGGADTSKASKIAHIPMWIVHGMDDVTVDPAFSTDMLQALTKRGAGPGFTLYPEVGHFSWIAAYSDPQIINWLFRQNKAYSYKK